MDGDHKGHRLRMRERFAKEGLSGFAPHEVLELLLFYAIPRQNVNPLAHRLINRFGSVEAVLNASQEQLTEVEGMGDGAAALIRLARELPGYAALHGNGGKQIIADTSAAEAHCRALLGGLSQEKLYAVCLSRHMELCGDVLLSTGTLDETPVYMREVAKGVLGQKAAAVILCHNHPGGSELPSRQDMEVTARVNTLLENMDIRLADHIIVAGERCFSMARHGLLRAEDQEG